MNNQQLPENFLTPQYVQPSTQMDPWAGYQGRLAYEFMKRKMAVDQEKMSLEQRYDHEKALLDLKLSYRLYLEMISCSVFLDTMGKLICAFTDSQGKMIASRVLTNVEHFEAKILSTSYPRIRNVLVVSWQGTNSRKKNVSFFDFDQALSATVFLKKLKSHGLLLLVSGRSEKKAADALLAYSVGMAPVMEIPFNEGWWKDREGNWHFAERGTNTLKGIEKNERF